MWKFALGRKTWPPEQPEPRAIRRTAPEPQPPGRPANQSAPQQGQCACPCRTVPNLHATSTLWSGRLTATFVSRVLPPPTPGNNRPGVQGDLLYRNPTGHIASRPLLTPQESAKNEPSSIEWAVRHVLKPKYPAIHHELMIAALEYRGDIAPGADPDFPNSVLATVPPENTHPQEPRL